MKVGVHNRDSSSRRISGRKECFESIDRSLCHPKVEQIVIKTFHRAQYTFWLRDVRVVHTFGVLTTPSVMFTKSLPQWVSLF